MNEELTKNTVHMLRFEVKYINNLHQCITLVKTYICIKIQKHLLTYSTTMYLLTVSLEDYKCTLS